MALLSLSLVWPELTRAEFLGGSGTRRFLTFDYFFLLIHLPRTTDPTRASSSVSSSSLPSGWLIPASLWIPHHEEATRPKDPHAHSQQCSPQSPILLRPCRRSISRSSRQSTFPPLSISSYRSSQCPMVLQKETRLHDSSKEARAKDQEGHRTRH